MPSRRNETHYNMNHKKRGIALIFNHELFDLDVESRHGTNEDAKSMKEMLEGLDFDVRMHNNNNITLLTQHVQDAANFNHSDYDCFVMVVLTHGEENDLLYARDNIYRLEILWSPFTACKCPSLAGKPKLFFIQACRGSQFMPSATAGQNRMDAPYNNSSYKIPAHADFLFAFASVPGYVAWLNRNTGSWFIQALCEEFKKNAEEYDILTLLTFVVKSVAIERYENCIEKQIPCVTTSLTRLLKFNKKRGWFQNDGWFQKSENVKTYNIKKEEKRNVEPGNANSTYNMIDDLFYEWVLDWQWNKYFKFITGLVASLFFALIRMFCSIPMIFKGLFRALQLSLFLCFVIIYICIFCMVKLILVVFLNIIPLSLLFAIIFAAYYYQLHQLIPGYKTLVLVNHN